MVSFQIVQYLCGDSIPTKTFHVHNVPVEIFTLKSTCVNLGVDSCCERTVRDSFASSLRRENTGEDGEGVVQGEENLL